MSEIAVVAWIAAGVLAVIVFLFCGYELWWKARRLQRDLARLSALGERVRRLQADVAEAQARLSRVGTD